MTCKFEQGVWSAAETAHLTGVAPLVQRAWRNRGFLAKRKSRRGFTSQEVAQLCALKAIRDRGLDLDQAAALAQRAGDVLWFAINHDPQRLIEPLGSFDQQRAFRAALQNAVDGADGDWPFLKAALGITGRSVVRFVAALSTEQIAITHLSDIFDSGEEEVAVVLDLLVIGRRLGERASRPLLIATKIVVDISVEQGSGQSFVFAPVFGRGA